jgi:predicted dehydrogenase
MGRTHLQQIQAAGMQAVAACDLDSARVAAATVDFPGIRTYTSVEDLLKDDEVDLCVVILPHNLHAPIAIQCSQAGKHVVVEKPMCITVAEADAMIEAAEKSDVMLTVFHNRRWDGDYRTIRDLIKEGAIGDVFHIEASSAHYGDPGTWWRADKKISGGALYDWGAHFIDWIQHFIPDKRAGVDGYFHKRHWLERTTEDHTEAIIRFESGKTAQLEISSLAAAGKSRWRILGTEGSIVQNGPTIDVTVNHKGHMATYSVKPPRDDWEKFYENIAGHLMRGDELVVKPEEARRTIGIIESAERSSAAKHTIVPKYQ